jgi:hypothetical protein
MSSCSITIYRDSPTSKKFAERRATLNRQARAEAGGNFERPPLVGRSTEEGRMVLKILGVAVLVWIAVSVLGAVFEFLTWALVIGAVVFVGAAAYSAVNSRSRRSLGR